MSTESVQYRVVRWSVFHLLVPPLLRLRVIGRHHLPPQGPFIIAANHISEIDPPLLLSALPRRPRIMAKKELWDRWVTRTLMEFGHAIPVQRGGADRAALRAAEASLAAGEPFGVFPEGTRVRGGRLARGMPGVGLIAQRAGVPVVPVAIEGTDKLLAGGRPRFRVPASITIGRPIHYEEIRSAGSAQAAADLIMSRIAEMLPPERRGEYSRRPEETGPLT